MPDSSIAPLAVKIVGRMGNTPFSPLIRPTPSIEASMSRLMLLYV
jgi:hypothetical protein